MNRNAHGRRLRAALLAVALGHPPAARAADPADLGASGNAYYYYCLAQHDRFQRNYLDAVNNLKNAVSYDPDAVELRLELARLYWLLGNRVNGFERNAIAQGEEAVRLGPEDLEAQRFLASVHATLAARGDGDPDSLERAILHHEKALALAAEDDRSNERFQLGKLYLQAGQYGNAAAILEEYVADDPDSVEALFWMSRAYVGLDELGAALHPLQRALELSPQSFNLSEAMLELQQRRGDVPGAIAAARRLLELAPDSLVGHTRLAQLYRLDGHPLDAAEVYAQAERLALADGEARAQSALPEIRLSRAEALREAGSLDQAAEAIAAGIGAHPKDPRFRILRCELQYLQGAPAAALESLQRIAAEEHDPAVQVPARISRVYLRLGARAEREETFERAEMLLQRAIDADPENDVALNYLGYLWAERGVNLERSIEYIQAALRIGGENAAYLDSLGWAYYQQKRYDLAEQHLARAAELSSDAEILEHLGDLYRATGRDLLAVDAWTRALGAGPEDDAGLRAKIQRISRPEEHRR